MVIRIADKISEEIKEKRKPTHAIHPIILNRWSPRAMSGEGMSDEELMPLFEAARWAPSSFNNQPWKFIYAKRETPAWNTFLGFMGEFNQTWTKNAAALVVVISKKTFEHNGKPSRTHQFDTGAAWENLALEGSRRGFVVHGMEGFDYDWAKKELEIPDDYEVMAMVAIGKRGKKEDLPEKLRANEEPSQRKPLNEILMEERFRKIG